MDTLNFFQNTANVSASEQIRRLELFVSIARGKAEAWHRDIDEYERDYYLVNTGDVTSNKLDRDLVRLSDLGDTVETMKSILMRSGWKLYIDRPGDNQVDKTKAGMLERYFKDLIRQIEERTGTDIEMTMVDYQARLSAAVVHWAYNPAPIIEALSYQPPTHIVPLDLWVCDPRSFFPVYGGQSGSKFDFIVHIEKRSLFSAYQLLESLFKDSPLALQEMQAKYGHIHPEYWYTVEDELIDYWGMHYIEGKWRVVNAVMFGKALLRPFQLMPGYDVIPWDIAPARDTKHKDLNKRILPIFYHMRPHVRQAEKYQGMMNTIMEKAASMGFVLELDPNSPEPPEIKNGKEFFITLRPGQKLNQPPLQQIPRDFYPQMEMIDRRIQKSGFPDGVQGLSGPASGMNSGYGYEQQQEGGLLRVTEPAEWLQRTLQTFFRNAALLIAKHQPQLPIVVNYSQGQPQVELRGADLLGWNIDVKWRSELPGDKLRKLTMAVQSVGAEITSRETAREMFMDIEDPARESELILQEKVLMTNPELAKAKAFELLLSRNALPNFTLAAQGELWMKIQQLTANLQATGAPPQVIQQAVQRMIQTEHMRLMMEYMMMPPTQQPGQPQGMPIGSQPAPSTPKDMDPQNGMVGPARAGEAPPGNPADPKRDLRGMINQ